MLQPNTVSSSFDFLKSLTFLGVAVAKLPSPITGRKKRNVQYLGKKKRTQILYIGGS